MYNSQIGTVRKRSISNSRHWVGNRYRSQTIATIKCLFTYGHNMVWHFVWLQRCTPPKNTFRQFVDTLWPMYRNEIIAFAKGIFANFRQRIGQIDRGQAGTFEKCLTANAPDGIWERYWSQIGTASKRSVVIPRLAFNRFDRIGYHNWCETCTILECSILDGRDGIGERHGNKICTTLKSAITNKSHSIGNVDRQQTLTVCKGMGFYFNHSISSTIHGNCTWNDNIARIVFIAIGHTDRTFCITFDIVANAIDLEIISQGLHGKANQNR